MGFVFIPMKKEYADEIAYSWKYDGIYSFYDMTADEDDLKEFLEEENWERSTFAVLDKDGGLAGFFSYYFDAKAMTIGFGLKPCLTGEGLGV